MFMVNYRQLEIRCYSPYEVLCWLLLGSGCGCMVRAGHLFVAPVLCCWWGSFPCLSVTFAGACFQLHRDFVPALCEVRAPARV